MRSAVEEFNGSRLQSALDARMWSVGMLSEMSGLSTSMLYYLLNDEKKPSYDTLLNISNTLKLPEDYFFKNDSKVNSHSFFRSYKRSTKTLRKSIKTKLEWVSEIHSFLSNHVKFPDLNIPVFEELKSRDPRNISLDEIENLAQKTRSYWGLSDGVIANTTQLLESNGFIITRFLLGNEDVDALSRIENDQVYILLASDKNSSSRNKFDNCHEAAHVVLHSNINKQVFDPEKNENHTLLEEQANRFAGAFLLPEVSFARDFTYPTLESFKALKVKWKVSIGLLVYRARDIGLINERTFKNLQINISKKGWRKNEPLEDRIEVEKPSLIKKAFELILDEELITVSEMEREIGLSQKEIENICGLGVGFFDKYKFKGERPKLRLVK